MSKFELSEKQQKIIAVIGIILFAAVSVFVILFLGKPLIKNISEPEKFKAWLDGFGAWGRLCYIGLVMLQVFFAVIPGEPFEIFAGYAFGAVEGTILNLIGTFVGGAVTFFFVRRFGMRAVRIFFSKEKIDSLRFLHTSAKREAILFFLFAVPGTPKDLLCYYAGLTDIDARRWLIFTIFGRLPSVVSSTIGGHALSSKNYLAAAVVFAVTVLLSAVGVWIYYSVCKKRQ